MNSTPAPSFRRASVCAGIVAASVFAWGCTVGCSTEWDDDNTAVAIDRQLAPATAVPMREGLAAAILIDVSGSMDERVVGEDGRREHKIDIARRATQGVVEQFERYAVDHPDEPVLLGIYVFSSLDGSPDLRPLVPMSAPNRALAVTTLAQAVADGGTPIGNAMIAGKRELDATGLARRHLVVVTDGANTDGFTPELVAAGIGRRPEAERPSIYFVAFDIEASRFDRVRDNGGLVLAAANAKELNETLDGLLRGKILVEQ